VTGSSENHEHRWGMRPTMIGFSLNMGLAGEERRHRSTERHLPVQRPHLAKIATKACQRGIIHGRPD